MPADIPIPPQDPDAPRQSTLPSGKVVEVRSHRTLTGLDAAFAIAAQTGVGAQSNADIHGALIARMATELSPGSSKAPTLDGTIDTVLAQRGDDYIALYVLVGDAYDLIVGRSVIEDLEDYADPKAPTTASSGPASDSGDSPQP